MPHALALAVALLVAAPGCIVTTKPVTREVSIGIEDTPADELDDFAGWDVTSGIDTDTDSFVVIPAHRQLCVRDRLEVFDEIETRESELNVPDVGPLAPLLLVFLPITAVSEVVAKIRVAMHDDTTTRKKRTLESIRGMCPHRTANVPVELTFPSGAVLMGVTDKNGQARFAIPDAEPSRGTAITRIGNQTGAVAFFKTTAGCVAARTETFAQLAQSANADQRSLLLRRFPAACGDAPRAWSRIVTAAHEAVESRCGSIVRLGGELRAIAPELYDTVFAVEPDIAQCLDGRTTSRLRHASCVAHRSQLMLEAQQIDNVDARARILTTLPDCDK